MLACRNIRSNSDLYAGQHLLCSISFQNACRVMCCPPEHHAKQHACWPRSVKVWRPELGGSQPRCGLMGSSLASHWAMRLLGADVLHGDRVPLLLGGPAGAAWGLGGRLNARGQCTAWPFSGDSRVPGTDADLRKEFLQAAAVVVGLHNTGSASDQHSCVASLAVRRQADRQPCSELSMLRLRTKHTQVKD